MSLHGNKRYLNFPRTFSFVFNVLIAQITSCFLNSNKVLRSKDLYDIKVFAVELHIGELAWQQVYWSFPRTFILYV